MLGHSNSNQSNMFTDLSLLLTRPLFVLYIERNTKKKFLKIELIGGREKGNF